MKYSIDDVIKIERLDNNKFKLPTINVDLCFICNFNCSYCYARRNNEFKMKGTKEQVDKMIRAINTLDFDRNITILGGEPTLSPYLKYYIDEIRKNNKTKTITLITNCSVFPDIDFNKIDCVLASFHSEQITVKKYFDNVLKYKDKGIEARCALVYKEENKDKIDKLVNLCRENNIKMYIDCGFNEKDEFYDIDFNIYENYKDVIFKTSRYYFKDNIYKDFYDYETIQNKLRCLDGFKCQMFEYTQSIDNPLYFKQICFDKPLLSFELNKLNKINHMVKCDKKLCTCQCMNIGDKVR